MWHVVLGLGIIMFHFLGFQFGQENSHSSKIQTVDGLFLGAK
jgi:hypothetical protein